MKKSIAIITARGGSKRIPGKNIREFCGKPVIYYSIEAALGAGLFSEVMVSTDSEEIADMARAKGASVPFLRSAWTSGDFATTSDVVMEVLNAYRGMGRKFDYGCCIYPTAPFVTAALLAQAMEALAESGAHTVLPIAAYSFPPQRGIVVRDGLARMQFPENLNARSQDLEPVYHDAGQFYAFNVSEFIKSGKLMGEKVIPLIRKSLEVQDIDNEEDWEIAEMKYELRKRLNQRFPESESKSKELINEI